MRGDTKRRAMGAGIERTEKGVRVVCTICSTPIEIDFADIGDRSEAERIVDAIDKAPRECPGFHVELNGWRKWWRLDDALSLYYGEVQS